MTETIRRRSLPDSLRWLADKLEADPVSEADRAGVAITLRSLADEIHPPVEACGAPNYSDRCELDAGHDGRHKDGNTSWPQGVERPVSGEEKNA